MNALTARWGPKQIRLWTGSAFAALLVHLVPAALLVVYIHWAPWPPLLADSLAALDVELASMPPAASPATSSRQGPSQPRTKPSPATHRQLAAVNPVHPLGQMQPVPQPGAVSSNAAPVADAGTTAAQIESSDLGASGTSAPALQLWEDEIVARLASHKEYPSSALQQKQQDTVMLQISVNHAGRVTYSRIDSTHHYPALEQEVQQMLRLAGRLPAPPPQLSADTVLTVPVQFSLNFMPDLLCGASGCPRGSGAHSKLKAVAPPAPTLASCIAADSPGPAPPGATATLEQMRAYRERLNQYLAAAGYQLACLSQVREVSTLALRDTLTRKLHSMVGGFNTQASVFKAKARAQALQAQQARQRQAKSLAAQVYGACKPPPVLRVPAALSARGAPAFRRHLIGYQSAVRTYVACLRRADLAAAAPDRKLASDQRVQLARSAVQLGDAAILSFNQVAGRFNTQVPHLRQQALAAQAQRNLAEVMVRARAIFPNSTWNVPAPLPTNECLRITHFGQTYRAQLCEPTYVARVSGLAQLLRSGPKASDPLNVKIQKIITNAAADALAGPGMAQATEQEAIAAQHGFPDSPCPPGHLCAAPILGIATTTEQGVQLQQGTAPPLRTISYSVSELQIAGRHLAVTISGKSDNGAGGVDFSSVHVDLVLSPDSQTLHGYCWTGQRRRACTLARHP